VGFCAAFPRLGCQSRFGGRDICLNGPDISEAHFLAVADCLSVERAQQNPNIARCDAQSRGMALARISLRLVSWGGWVPSIIATIMSGATQLMRATRAR